VPTGYTMDWAGSSASPATELPAYEPVRVRAAQARARRPAPVDPGATRDAVLKLVDSPNPPLRLFLGEAPPQAGFTGVVAASRNRSSSASRAREWLLAAMPAVRLASNG
jgi:hypothetical protein